MAPTRKTGTRRRKSFIRDPQRAEELVLAAIGKALQQNGGLPVKLSSQEIFDLIPGNAKPPSPATVGRTRERLIAQGTVVGKQDAGGMWEMSLPAGTEVPARRGRRPKAVVETVMQTAAVANEVEVFKTSYQQALEDRRAAEARLSKIKEDLESRIGELQGLLTEMAPATAAA